MAGGSKRSRITPSLGEALLISAMTAGRPSALCVDEGLAERSRWRLALGFGANRCKRAGGLARHDFGAFVLEYAAQDVRRVGGGHAAATIACVTSTSSLRRSLASPVLMRSWARGYAIGHGGRNSGCVDGGAGVEGDDVGGGFVAAGEGGAHQGEALCGGVGGEVVDGTLADAEVARHDIAGFDGSALEFRDGRGAVDGEFVQAIGMDDQDVFGAEQAQHLGKRPHPFGREDADHLTLGAGGVGEGAEQVEDGAKAEFPPYRASESHGGVVRHGEQETYAHLGNAAPHLLGGDFELHARGLQHVRTAALAGHAAIAVLGDVGAGGGGHEGGGGGDVEALRPAAAAGAAGVDEVRDVHLHLGGNGAHGGGRAGDLFGGLAPDGEGGEDAADLRRRRFAREDEVEDGCGLGLRQRLAGSEMLQRFVHVHGGVARIS